MSTKYVLALDQGTTSSRAILFDNEQNIIAVQGRIGGKCITENCFTHAAAVNISMIKEICALLQRGVDKMIHLVLRFFGKPHASDCNRRNFSQMIA